MPPKNKNADQILVRKHNTALIFAELKNNEPLSRAQLAAKVGITRSTASSIVNDLLEVGTIQETELERPQNGRPGMLLEINPLGGCAVGVDINVDFISIVLMDFRGEVVWDQVINSDPTQTRAKILKRAEKLVNEALIKGAENHLRHLGIGVGLPGLVDTSKGALAFAPNLKWKDLTLGEKWTKKFGMSVYIENEANAAAMGEYCFGTAKGAKSMIYLSAGAGLGGAIVLDGKLFGGVSGYAGEIGHMQIDPNGELCGCGRRGCWETFVGPGAVIKRVSSYLKNEKQSKVLDLIAGGTKKLDLDKIIEGAESKDKVCIKSFKEVGEFLGSGIANLMNIFNPELVVLGGELSKADKFILPAARNLIKQCTHREINKNTKIVAASNNIDACAVGAATLVLDVVHNDPLRAFTPAGLKDK